MVFLEVKLHRSTGPPTTATPRISHFKLVQQVGLQQAAKVFLPVLVASAGKLLLVLIVYLSPGLGGGALPHDPNFLVGLRSC